MLFYFFYFSSVLEKEWQKKLSQTIRAQWNVGMEQLVQLIHAFTADTVKQELDFNWSGCLRKWKSRIIQKFQKSYNSRSEQDKYSPKYRRTHFSTLGLKGWLIDSSLEKLKYFPFIFYFILVFLTETNLEARSLLIAFTAILKTKAAGSTSNDLRGAQSLPSQES